MSKSENSSTPKATVSTVLEQIEQLDYDISIFMEIADHLNQFIKTDFEEPTEGIKVWRGGAAAVPPERVQEYQQEVFGYIDEAKELQKSLLAKKVEKK
jgi:hypothetical protein